MAGAVPILFIPISVDSFILPRVSLLLVGTALGCAGAIWSGSIRGLGVLRRPALLVCLAAATAGVLSVAPLNSLAGEYTRYESWPVRVAYVGAFCTSVWLLRTPADVRRVGSWFCLGVTVCAAEAVAQAALGLLPRPDGNLGQPGLLGVLCAMALPLAIWRAHARWRWLPVVILLGLGLLASGARSAWVAAVMGSLVAALLLWPRWWRQTLLTGTAATAAVVAVILLSPLRLLNADTGSARLHVWQDSLRLIAARPLFGWGEETTGQILPRFLTGDWEPGNHFDRLHSVPLDLLATQGVFGLVSTGLFFLILWRTAIAVRASLANETRVLLGSCAAYSTWSLLNFDWAPATGIFWILAGAAWWGAGAVGGVGGVGAGPARGLRPAAAAVALAGVLAGAAPVVADIAYHSGQIGLARRIDPIQSQYWGR